MMAKTILITGSSSGFGRMTIPLLLEQGHTVIAALRGGQARMESLFAAEIARHPGRMAALDLPMEREDSPRAARELIDSRFGGKLDVLVNNAGFGLFGALEDFSPAQLRHQFEVNFFGPALLARELLPALRAARGRIINVSSIAGLRSFPFYGAYSSSKYALEGMSEGMRYDLEPHGVQVCLIEPGGFRTSFKEARVIGEGSSSPSSPYFDRMQGLIASFARPSRRHDDPIRVARLIALYCVKERIPLRRVIGRDAAMISFMSWLLPDAAFRALIRLIFRRGVFSLPRPR